jgi:two-component system, OmpR family, copper resistance phosphate regulon response regulator CusR
MEETILIVEDESKIADSLKQGLIEEGYRAEVAYDGNEGREMFKSKQYDVVVLDINLPGINGYELCKIIRSLNSQVPVIMLTALSTLEDKIIGYDSGADDYIIKPFEFKELLMKIRVLLKRSATPVLTEDSILKAADLEMNLDSKIVWRAGKEINLTVKEFQLLEYLLRNKNKVVSRSDIAIHVWEIDFFTNTNVIDVYINYLRNKVDKPFAEKLIQTQTGRGYILKDNP